MYPTLGVMATPRFMLVLSGLLTLALSVGPVLRGGACADCEPSGESAAVAAAAGDAAAGDCCEHSKAAPDSPREGEGDCDCTTCHLCPGYSVALVMPNAVHAGFVVPVSRGWISHTSVCSVDAADSLLRPPCV